MSNDDSWALRDLRYHKIPELERRIRSLEEYVEILKYRLDAKEAEGLAEI